MRVHFNDLQTDENFLLKVQQQLKSKGFLIVKLPGFDDCLEKLSNENYFNHVTDHIEGGKIADIATVYNIYKNSDFQKEQLVQEYYSFIDPLKRVLLNSLELSKSDNSEWKKIIANENCALSYINYPAKENGVKMASHSDSTIFTFLGGIDNEGLEAFIEEEWIKIESENDEIVVINGALLHFMSEKTYPALFHRVAYNKNKIRRTIATLVQPILSHVIKFPQSNLELSYNSFHRKRLLVM